MSVNGMDKQLNPKMRDIIIHPQNENVIILTKFSALATPEVVILTTSGVAGVENFVKMTSFPF